MITLEIAALDASILSDVQSPRISTQNTLAPLAAFATSVDLKSDLLIDTVYVPFPVTTASSPLFSFQQPQP